MSLHKQEALSSGLCRLANLAGAKGKLTQCNQESAERVSAVVKEVDDHASLVATLSADLLHIHRKCRRAGYVHVLSGRHSV